MSKEGRTEEEGALLNWIFIVFHSRKSPKVDVRVYYVYRAQEAFFRFGCYSLSTFYYDMNCHISVLDGLDAIFQAVHIYRPSSTAAATSIHWNKCRRHRLEIKPINDVNETRRRSPV